MALSQYLPPAPVGPIPATPSGALDPQKWRSMWSQLIAGRRMLAPPTDPRGIAAALMIPTDGGGTYTLNQIRAFDAGPVRAFLLAQWKEILTHDDEAKRNQLFTASRDAVQHALLHHAANIARNAGDAGEFGDVTGTPRGATWVGWGPDYANAMPNVNMRMAILAAQAIGAAQKAIAGMTYLEQIKRGLKPAPNYGSVATPKYAPVGSSIAQTFAQLGAPLGPKYTDVASTLSIPQIIAAAAKRNALAPHITAPATVAPEEPSGLAALGLGALGLAGYFLL